jgi:hypothetical protein
MGRPAFEFTEENMDFICEKIAESSLGLVELHEQFKPNFPAKSDIYRELAKNEVFRDKYAQARQMQAEAMADEILRIADDGSNDLMTISKGNESYEVENKEVVNRSRLRVDTRKWLMSKLLPKKYGDRLELDNKHSGSVDLKPITGMNIT